MLKLVILRHEAGELDREIFDLGCQSKLFDEAIRVLFQLFRLDLLIGIELVNLMVKSLNLLMSFIVLAGLVACQILKKDLTVELCERSRKDVCLEFKELVDHFLVLYVVEDLSC